MNNSNQLRKNLIFTKKHVKRAKRWKHKLEFLGENVFFDKKVDLMRHPENISIEDNVVIKEGAKICSCNDSSKIKIGRNTTFGYYSFLFASNKITIGEDCLIAPFVYLVDSDHNIAKNQLINQQPNSTAPITIGNDVWIGTGAKILKGVNIGNGAVIAAGSLVKDNVKDFEIWGGIPAKKISERK